MTQSSLQAEVERLTADQLDEAALRLLTETSHRGLFVRLAAAFRAGDMRDRARNIRARHALTGAPDHG